MPLREGLREASDAVRLYARLTKQGSLTIANIRCIDARVQSVQLSGMTRVPQCRKHRKS